MKSFLRYFQILDRKASSALSPQSRINPVKRDTLPTIYKNLGLSSRSHRDGNRRSKITAKCLASFWLWGSAITAGSFFFVATPAAEALPKRKDWCGIIWSLESTPPATAPYQIAHVNALSGASSFTTPNANITMPSPGLPNTGVNGAAALGIHVQSGTLFAMNRDGAGQLYKYRFGYDTTWKPVTTNLPGIGAPTNVNLNKMTVDGDFLYLTSATATPLYSLQLDPTTGALLGPNATVTAYTNTGIPSGSPVLNGGDITTDEYGDTYNITYDSAVAPATTKIFFFKQNTTSNTWEYQGQAVSDDISQFGGAAFYRGDLYLKSSTGKFKKVDITRSGTGYTGWGNLSAPGVGNPSTDLAACGTPNLIINKTQKIYTNAAATSLSPNQGSVKTGQYIKYTITVQNTGDSWARASNIADTLPAGSAYVPNSAALNGANLNLATYPTSGFVVNTPGAATGIIDFSAPPSIATLTFVVQVTATTGSVQNRATITYVDNTGLASEPPDCNEVPTPFNCGLTPVTPTGEQLLLVKRITAINDQTTNPNDGKPLTGFVDDGVANNADNNSQWPSGYLVGAIDGGKIKSGDKVEYTIYYLNNGYSKLKAARICDRLDTNLNYVNDFNASNIGKGISFTNPSGATNYLTNTNTDSDRGEFVASGGAIPPRCNLTGSANPSGIVVVDAADAANLMTPAGYGQIKFKTTVK